MKKILFLTFCILVIQPSISGTGSSYADDASLNHLNEWPLSALSGQERMGKINQYIKPYDYKLITWDGFANEDMAKSECNSRLKQIKNISLDKLQTPVHVAKSPHDDWIKNLLSSCKDIDIDKEFHPSKEVWDIQKDTASASSYYFQATANTEVYDLSAILGQGNWVVFEEGGVPQCKDSHSEDCKNMVGYKTIGKKINIPNCRSENIDMSGAARLLPLVKSQSKGHHDVSYYKTNNFYALVLLDGDHPYRITFKTDDVPLGSCSHSHDNCPMTEKGTKLSLYMISGLSSETHVSCVFEPVLGLK